MAGHVRIRPVGTLYVVATPIGNLADLSPRALEALRAVPVIAAEDTRVTRKLVSRFTLTARLLSLHAHSTPAALAQALRCLEEADLALVSDAGTPGVADPGPALVAAALEAGHRVCPLPGPSAVSCALAASGLPADRYQFLGFLPRRGAERLALLRSLADDPWTLVCFETPQRLRAALADLVAALGAERTVVVARELTKLHEEVWRGSLTQAAERWATVAPRGEFTLVLAGAAPQAREAWDEARIRGVLAQALASGESLRAASRRLAEPAGRPAKELYRLGLDLGA